MILNYFGKISMDHSSDLIWGILKIKGLAPGSLEVLTLFLLFIFNINLFILIKTVPGKFRPKRSGASFTKKQDIWWNNKCRRIEDVEKD